MPEKTLVSRKIITYDTKENRLIKFIINKIILKIERFKKVYLKTYNEQIGLTKPDEVIIKKLDGFKNNLYMKINSSFLKNIKPEFTDASFSLVFAMGSGYREVYKYYLMLQKGLSIKSNIFALSAKDLSVLYEYWCFIKINSLLQKKYRLITCDMIKTNREGIVVTLKKNNESSLTYENPDTGEIFIVSYNKTADSKTVSQKPDNMLLLNKKGAKKQYQFIFDAKYKIDTSEQYIMRNHTAGPKEEDINTMHRYRDAIIYSNSDVSNCVFGAFVLFPYKNEEEFKENTFYKCIKDVNIGAMPFLPSTTKLMEEFLNEIIEESPYSNFERTVRKTGQDDYYRDKDFTNRNILVGVVKDPVQYDANKKYLFYHIPKKRVNLLNKRIEYVALYKPKKTFGDEGSGITHYGAVSHVEEVTRSDIKELPKDSDEIYYKFTVDKWIKADHRIVVDKISIRNRIYTSYYLLCHADTISYLLIKNKYEYRIMTELKRLSSNTDVEINEDMKVSAFKVNNCTITIDEKTIINNTTKKEIPLKDFKNKPRKCLKMLLDCN